MPSSFSSEAIAFLAMKAVSQLTPLYVTTYREGRKALTCLLLTCWIRWWWRLPLKNQGKIGSFPSMPPNLDTIMLHAPTQKGHFSYLQISNMSLPTFITVVTYGNHSFSDKNWKGLGFQSPRMKKKLKG